MGCQANQNKDTDKPKVIDDNESNVSSETLTFENPSLFQDLSQQACNSFGKLPEKYQDLKQGLCPSIFDVSLTQEHIYLNNKNGKAVKIIEERLPDNVSRFGYLLPMFAEVDTVRFYQYLMTGVMQKSIGSDIFDENVSAYNFVPRTQQEQYVTASYSYQLDYSQSFGDIAIQPSTLDMHFDWLYFPESSLYLVADTSQQILEDGLFKKWGLYLFFIEYEGKTLAIAYLDMIIANLGIHDVILQEYLTLAGKLPPMIFRSIPRVE